MVGYRSVPADDIEAPRAAQLRVASVPSSHVYVRHLARPADSRTPDPVVRLPDPHPSEPGRSAVSQWWPPRMLDPQWARENLSNFDVFHIQFGFDAVAPAELADLARVLHAAGKPLVYTAHDLRNPHHVDSAEHDAQLTVLMDEADAVVTLTSGAAEEIYARWGRRATVIPHPHVVDFSAMARLGARRPSRGTGDPFRVGLHVKSLRANMNPAPLVRALAETRFQHPETIIQVDGHPDVLDEGGARYDAELSTMLKDYDRRGVIDLRVHDYFTDDELWRYLASLDASILPYRFGTHSGWLEACRDLGTDVIAPTCGHYADQAPVRLYGNDENGFDADSLIAAVAESSRAEPSVPVGVAYRQAQRDDIAARHEALYSWLLA